MRPLLLPVLLAMIVTAACVSRPPLAPQTDELTSTAGSTPAPTSGWTTTWRIGDEEDYRWVVSNAHTVTGRSEKAWLYVTCSKDLSVTTTLVRFPMPEYESALATVQAPRGYSKDEATAVAWVKRIFKIDDVFISRRTRGDPGRWEKSGWKSLLTNDGIDLRDTPSDAFIRELAAVEELAVLVTDDAGLHIIQAAFDVRQLREALASKEAAWNCSIP